MSVLSGKYSAILLDSCNMLEFESWDLTFGTNIQEYNSRSGGGATQTAAGVDSGSGTITGFLDPDDPITGQVSSGDLVTAQFYADSGGTTKATGKIRLGQIHMSANRDGTLIPVSIPFTTHGALTFPS